MSMLISSCAILSHGSEKKVNIQTVFGCTSSNKTVSGIIIFDSFVGTPENCKNLSHPRSTWESTVESSELPKFGAMATSKDWDAVLKPRTNQPIPKKWCQIMQYIQIWRRHASYFRHHILTENLRISFFLHAHHWAKTLVKIKGSTSPTGNRGPHFRNFVARSMWSTLFTGMFTIFNCKTFGALLVP